MRKGELTGNAGTRPAGRRERMGGRDLVFPAVHFFSASRSPENPRRKTAMAISKQDRLLLFHWTPERNFASIVRQGLRCKFSIGKQKGIWLCDENTVHWAWMHVSQWQEVSQEEMVLLAVVLSRNLVRKMRRGIYVTFVDISPTVIFLPK